VVVPAPRSAGQPKTGGILRIGIVGDLPSLDGNDFGAAFDVTYPIFNDLGQQDDKLNLSPELAESFDLSSDFRLLKVNLRKGVQFHTGRELTSDDIKYSLQRAQNPKTLNRATVGPGASYWNSIETPDKYTVILESEQSRPSMFDFFQQFNMGDRTVLEGPDAKTKASGTGPFMFVEWVQGDHITITRNPNYWQSGRPYLDSIVTRIFAGDQPGLLAGRRNARPVAHRRHPRRGAAQERSGLSSPRPPQLRNLL
jgi:peptide/nickel transport system substrate-binding protein